MQVCCLLYQMHCNGQGNLGNGEGGLEAESNLQLPLRLCLSLSQAGRQLKQDPPSGVKARVRPPPSEHVIGELKRE